VKNCSSRPSLSSLRSLRSLRLNFFVPSLRSLRSLRLKSFAFFAVALSAVSLRAQSPANDQFNNRLILTGSYFAVTGSNTNATKQKGEPNHAGNSGGASVWWAWTAPTNGDVVITTDGSDFDTLLGVYTGSTVSSLSLVATNDDHSVFISSRVRFQAVAGTQYQIAVDGFNDGTNTDSGNITLNLLFVPQPPRPANDNFTNSIALSGSAVTTTGSNIEATHEPGEPLHAGKAGDTSVWWTWTAPANDTVMLTTAGSTFDTLLAVYTGSSLSNLAQVASNDDVYPADGIQISTVYFNALAGQTYQIAVDGYDGASGQISLKLATVTARLTMPTPLPDGSFQFSVTATAGQVFEVDATADFVTWTPLGTLTNITGTANFSDTSAGDFPRRFYRARSSPDRRDLNRKDF